MSTYNSRIAYLAGQTQRIQPQVGMWPRLRAMMNARRTRHLLAGMDDRMLADIGLGRGDASTEAARPMWDIETLR